MMGETQSRNLTTAMDTRPPLDGQRFEIIVIGGGITGVAIARECARAGRRTLLLEQHDFAAGTTSRSTRIIHGGLRYLEHGDIVQVRESLRERQSLLRNYPNLVCPLEFVLALDENSRRSALAVRAGLWLYRRLGGAQRRNHAAEAQAQLERLLDGGRRFSLFSFEDGQCEFPERLVAEWLVEAIEAGCVARNHTQVLAVEISNGRATGVRLRDALTGKEEQVEAARVVNAWGRGRTNCVQVPAFARRNQCWAEFAVPTSCCHALRVHLRQRCTQRPWTGGLFLSSPGTNKSWWAAPKFPTKAILTGLPRRRMKSNTCCDR